MDMATQAIESLTAAFRRDMEALPAATWDQASDCAGWTIKAAFIHVVQVCDFLADSIARGRAGDAGPPPLAMKEGIAAWRAARGERQKEAMAQPPADVLAWYDRACATMNAELAAIPSAPADAQGWHPVGARSLAWVRDQWLFEVALHDWDIRVALDPAAEVRPDILGAFARTLPGRIGRGFGAGDDSSLDGLYRIEVSCDPPLTFAMAVSGGAASEASDDGSPVATIHTDATALGLVTSNRRPVDQFIDAGRWRATGDSARADAFARAFRSY